MKKRFILSSLLFILFFILSFVNINFVSAFGYISYYTDDVPLQAYPGESKTAQVELGVTPNEGDLTIKAEMLDNASIAELADSNLEYEIGPGKNAVVSIILKVPAKAAIGEHLIQIKFSDITPSEAGGTVGVRGGMIVPLKVFVIEKPKPVEEKISLAWIILWLVAVIAATAIIYFIIRVIKSKKKISGENL